METAASAPTHKTLVGAGLSFIQIAPKEESITRSALFLGQEDEALSLTPQKLYLYRGLIYPVSGGLSLANLPGKAGQISGSLQWTIYEDFFRPAFSIRLGYSRMLELAGTDFSSFTGEIFASWGYRYVTAYLGAGFGQHKGRTSNKAFPSAAEFENTEFIQTYGLQAQLLRPPVKINLELQQVGASPTSAAIKISFQT